MQSKNVMSHILFDMQLNKNANLHDDLNKRDEEITFLPLRYKAREGYSTENWMQLVFEIISFRNKITRIKNY